MKKELQTNIYGMILVFIFKSYICKDNSLERGNYYPTLGSRYVGFHFLLLLLLDFFNPITLSTYVILKYANLEKNRSEEPKTNVTEKIKNIFKITIYK